MVSAPLDNGLFGRFDDVQSSEARVAVLQSSPVNYDPNTGVYTWTDQSLGNQTMNAVDASQQFPSDGFLGGDSGLRDPIQGIQVVLTPGLPPGLLPISAGHEGGDVSAGTGSSTPAIDKSNIGGIVLVGLLVLAKVLL